MATLTLSSLEKVTLVQIEIFITDVKFSAHTISTFQKLDLLNRRMHFAKRSYLNDHFIYTHPTQKDLFMFKRRMKKIFSKKGLF